MEAWTEQQKELLWNRKTERDKARHMLWSFRRRGCRAEHDNKYEGFAVEDFIIQFKKNF